MLASAPPGTTVKRGEAQTDPSEPNSDSDFSVNLSRVYTQGRADRRRRERVAWAGTPPRCLGDTCLGDRRVRRCCMLAPCAHIVIREPMAPSRHTTAAARQAGAAGQSRRSRRVEYRIQLLIYGPEKLALGGASQRRAPRWSFHDPLVAATRRLAYCGWLSAKMHS